MKKQTGFVLYAFLLIFPITTMSAPITWQSAKNTTGKAQLIEGDVVLALSGGTGATVSTAGTTGTSSYTFTAMKYTDFAFSPSPTSNTYPDASSGASSTGDSNFDNVIKSFSYTTNGITSGIQAISGLTDGASYKIQVFYNDQRLRNRVMTFGDGQSPENKVNISADGSNWGQHAVGTFISDGTSQLLTHATNGFGNVHVNAIVLVLDESIPVPTLSAESNTASAPFTINVVFTEAVSGLQESDFIVDNGEVTPSSLVGSGDTWSIEITPSVNGDVSVALPADSVIDTDGENNQNIASNTLVTTYISPGSDQPTVTLTTDSSVVTDSYIVDITFDESVTGLMLDDFNVTNGSLSNLLGSEAVYSLLITPDLQGDISLTLPANRVTDTDGDGLKNTASQTLITTFRIPDSPTVVLYGSQFSEFGYYNVYLTFSEDVTGLADSDFNIVNGSASRTIGNGRYYSTTITVHSPGQVEVMLTAGAVTDVDGDSNLNPDSNTLITKCTSSFNEQWIVDDELSWDQATSVSSNMDIASGFAEPTADSSQFTSIIKTFSTSKKASNLTFRQSPVWDNWIGVSNVGPSDARDAPVLIPFADNDYYFLGLGSSGGYHAWHSTDMVNWTHYGPVTAPTTGRWVTSAEYKDGEFYIYSDYYNDHTPHLFIDSNLKDGVVGTYMGAAFVKETHGSDCSLIRSDEDGLFHLIYEDWSPINARTHSWDSPLAGHTSSQDGLTGFDPHEHHPPVDRRTTPTGRFATYDHPNVPDCIYEIHEPAQDAFGDWTSIKIGSRFYLFSDYDQHDGGIKVARFTSESIYAEYELVGSFGGGHPDPTVGFAQGRFYLITQQNTDHVSPGPWVDGVQARAGVDTDGDGTIDQWTAWQTVVEQYSHTPEFIRVVNVTPAQLDMSELPEGYGFQYEFRIDNTVVSGVSPIIDSVEMEFERLCDHYIIGDQDYDCDVDFEDLQFVAIKWLEICDTDCDSDLKDFALMAINWLVNCNTDPDNPSCIPMR